MHAAWRAAPPALVALATACLFSSTPPKPSGGDSNNPPTDPNTATVVGSLLHFGLVDRVYRRTPGRAVTVLYLGRDRDGDGAPDRLKRSIVFSDRSGTYQSSYTSREIQYVELKAYTCSHDPDATDLLCCIDEPPCPPAQCNIWTAPRRYTLAPGSSLRQDIIVPCMQ